MFYRLPRHRTLTSLTFLSTIGFTISDDSTGQKGLFLIMNGMYHLVAEPCFGGRLHTSVATLLALLLWESVAVHACADRPAPDLPSNDIAALIRDLSDRSYEVRTVATRRLCAIGAPAREMLEAAASGPDTEASIRAKRVLKIVGQLYFSGVDVSLSFVPPEAPWDSPVELRLTFTNQGQHPALVPFALGQMDNSNKDARQVGNMLDAAEWLHVRSPQGQEIDLRVDDITSDPAVNAEVQQRLKAGSSSILQSGQAAVLTVPAFNRGWARYPLIEQGEYSVSLRYDPTWEDEDLKAQGIGRVVSNSAKLTILSSAPPAVSRTGAEATLTLSVEGPILIARLTNRSDQVLHVNKNYGRGMPFAEGSWVYSFGDAFHEISASAKPSVHWTDFDTSLLVAVPPGETLEMAATEVGTLRQAFERAGADLSGGRWTVFFAYSNSCDRQWQMHEGQNPVDADGQRAPKVLPNPLPRRILSSRHVSNSLVAPEK